MSVLTNDYLVNKKIETTPRKPPAHGTYFVYQRFLVKILEIIHFMYMFPEIPLVYPNGLDD